MRNTHINCYIKGIMKIIKNNTKTILIIFAIFDAILFVRFWQGILAPFSYNWGQYFIIGITILIRSITVLSFAFSSYALFLQKKWAFLLYYIQFIFRMGFCYLSIGFLTFLSFRSQKIYFSLMLLAFLAELLRLFVTIRINKLTKI